MTTFGKIVIEEQSYRIKNQHGKTTLYRPFTSRVGVHTRAVSMRLQRAITDFGADKAFKGCEGKIKEHYGIDVGQTTIRRITEFHAQQLSEKDAQAKDTDLKSPAKKQLISQTDGCFIPIVTPQSTITYQGTFLPVFSVQYRQYWVDSTGGAYQVVFLKTIDIVNDYPYTIDLLENTAEADSIMDGQITLLPEENAKYTVGEILFRNPDKRKHKTIGYREARLSLLYEQGVVEPIFSGTFDSVDKVGHQLMGMAKKVGYDNNTKVHAVGDGAAWIPIQIEEQFGANSSYLVDLFHVCEYLAAAAPACTGDKETAKEWVAKQKDRLKANQVSDVLEDLKAHVEANTINLEKAPVRACQQYLTNRLEHLDYKSAIEKGLPVGSGKIESAHRYVIQQRLKISGAGWLLGNAEHMLALRTCRANDEWAEYWITAEAA